MADQIQTDAKELTSPQEEAALPVPPEVKELPDAKRLKLLMRGRTKLLLEEGRV